MWRLKRKIFTSDITVYAKKSKRIYTQITRSKRGNSNLLDMGYSMYRN